MIESLRQAELFAGLTDGQCRSVAPLARERQAVAGSVLFRFGDEASEFYLIRQGKVELTFPLQVMGETKDVRLQVLEAGRTLAWSALVPPHRLTMSARAATEVALLAFDRQETRALLQEQPAIGYVVMSNLASVVAARLAEHRALWVREVQRNVSQTYR